MKALLFGCGVIVAALAGYYAGSRLSDDDLSMLIGVLFGIMASLPALLIAFAGKRNTEPPVKPFVSTYQPQLPEPTTWRVVERRQIDATVNARRIEVKR